MDGEENKRRDEVSVRMYMCCVYGRPEPGIAGQPCIWLERYGQPCIWLERYEEISFGSISINHEISSPLYICT